MKLLATIRSTLTIVAILMFSSIAFAGHASAMSTTSHEKCNGSHHNTNQSPSCIALCTTATLKDEKEIKLTYEENDNDPAPPKSLPFYALNSSNFTPKKLASSYIHNQLILRPPDLVKLYSNYRF